jgi:hypothetical protein
LYREGADIELPPEKEEELPLVSKGENSTNGKPTHHHRWSEVYIWHPIHNLASRRQWGLLHEVQVSIMVSIISISNPFDYVVS